MNKNIIKIMLLSFITLIMLFSFTREISANTFSISGDYETQNLSLRLRYEVGSTPLRYYSSPVVVSPRVYGITRSGVRTHVYTMPSTHYTRIPNYQVYSVPRYYLQPSFVSYQVITYARPTTYWPISGTITIPTTVLDAPYEPTPQVYEPKQPAPPKEYYLSGNNHVFINNSETYFLEIVNESNKPLNIIAIQTNNPPRLQAKVFNRPFVVAPNTTEYASVKLDLFGPKVNYSGQLEINVIARYGNQPDIRKQKIVNYHISN